MISLLMAIGLSAAGIRPPTQVLRADAISQSVQTELARRLDGMGIHARVDVASRIADETLPAGQVKVEVGPIAGRWPRTHSGVPVRLLVDGRAVRTLTVWVDLHDPQSVLTYADSYPGHTDDKQLRFTSATVDMMCCNGAPLRSPVATSPARLKRRVTAGAPAMAADFEPIPDVVAQQAVAIEVAHGPVRVMARGIALDDGYIGGRVRVRALTAPAPVQAQVIAKQKVQVNE